MAYNISQNFLSHLNKYQNLINNDRWDEWYNKLRNDTGYNFDDGVNFGKLCDSQKIKGYFTLPIYYISALNKIVRSIRSNVEGKISGYIPTEGYIEFELINNDDGEVFVGGRLYFSNSNIEFDMWNNGEVILGWNELLDYLDNIFRDNKIKVVIDPKAYKVEILK